MSRILMAALAILSAVLVIMWGHLLIQWFKRQRPRTDPEIEQAVKDLIRIAGPFLLFFAVIGLLSFAWQPVVDRLAALPARRTRKLYKA